MTGRGRKTQIGLDGDANAALADPNLRPIITDERAAFRPVADVTQRYLPQNNEDTGSQTTQPSPASNPVITKPFATRKNRMGGLHAAAQAIPTIIEEAVAEEIAHGTLFLLIPVFLLAGALIYFALPVEPALHNIPVALALCLGIAWAVRKNSLALMPVLAVVIVVGGMGLGQLKTFTVDTQMLGSDISTRVTGRIVQIENRANGSARYTIDIMETARPKLRYAPETIRATMRTAMADLRVGDVVQGPIRLLSPSGPVRPDGYDFAFNAYFDGYGANGFFLGQPEIMQTASLWHRIQQPKLFLADARNWLGRHIIALNDNSAGAVASALIMGDKSAIPDDVTEALRRSGLAHILSISGLHMALVAGTVMLAIRLLLSGNTVWSAAHPVRKYAAAAALSIAAIYLFLAGSSVATQRSFVMLAVMLCALLIDRSAFTKRNLAIAAIAVIVFFPNEVGGPSFQMSFAATLALIAVYDVWGRRRNRKARTRNGDKNSAWARKFLVFFAGLAATSLIAGFATGIYSVYHFQRVAAFGLLANMAAMPLVSLLTMPTAILGVLAIPTGLDWLFFAIMFWSIDQVIDIATWVSEISPTGLTGAVNTNAIVFATIALVLFCLPRTSLRYVAIVPAMTALVLTGQTQRPDFFISEDGRQVAMAGDGVLYANRARPSAFIYEQWTAAVKSTDIAKPVETGSKDAPNAQGFQCDANGICFAKKMVGATAAARVFKLVHLSKPLPPDVLLELQPELCAADIVIESYAPAMIQCREATIITAQQLAINGSAAITLSRVSATAEAPFLIEHAIGRADSLDTALLRPWHTHRQFSRAARNMAPYKAP